MVKVISNSNNTLTAKTKRTIPSSFWMFGALLLNFFGVGHFVHKLSEINHLNTLSEINHPKTSTNRFLPNCARAAAHPLWMNEKLASFHPTEFEKNVSNENAGSFDFLDPISCTQSSTSFAGSSWHREAGISSSSGASNRHRQVALAVTHAASAIAGRAPERGCLQDFQGSPLSVYNTDASSSLHKALEKLNFTKYVASEYLPECEDKKSGTVVNGVRHEDLQKTSFDDESFDVVISTEVFEHIPFPYKAHKEVYRILRPGGAHVFTVPFLVGEKHDLKMSSLDPTTGVVTHGPGRPPHFVPPQYHGDPLRPGKGVLVFTLFGNEMVKKLCSIGFDVEVSHLYSPKVGIIGEGAIVFTAWKV